MYIAMSLINIVLYLVNLGVQLDILKVNVKSWT